MKGIERSSASEGVERIERTRASRTADARFGDDGASTTPMPM